MNKSISVTKSGHQNLLQSARSDISAGNYGAAYKSYSKLLRLKQVNEELRLEFGVFLARIGNSNEAMAQFETILEKNPNHRVAASHLSDLYRGIIPNWHILMLADENRNEAYSQAISAAVNESDTVLEIGTGTGLLSLFAARAGAKSITSCEVIAPIARIAQKIIHKNGYHDQIRVINKHSTNLTIGEDLRRRATVLISEIFDAGLLGEGVIGSLRHAVKNLVTADAKIIPASATVYGIPVSVPFYDTAHKLENISGFDLSPFCAFSPSNTYAVNMNSAQYTALAEAQEIFRFDFKNIPETSRKTQVSFDIAQGGICHGICYWFNLHLDEATLLDRSPGQDGDHWHHVLQLFPSTPAVMPGNELLIRAYHDDTGFGFAISDDVPT